MSRLSMQFSPLRVSAIGMCLVTVAGCQTNDILRVPPPANVVASGALEGKTGGEDLFNSARYSFINTLGGPLELIELSELLSDELTNAYVGEDVAVGNQVDARRTVYEGEAEDGVIRSLLQTRNSLLLSENVLQQYELGSSRSMAGEAYALAGYAELLMAEDYCAGVPLTQATLGGSFTYGSPLSSDSLLGTAEAHFDSALAYAENDDTIQNLAEVGLGRTLVDRGRYDSASAAVADVPTSFVYQMVYPYEIFSYAGEEDFYTVAEQGCGDFAVSDSEGGTGLGFVSASDPRLMFSRTLVETCDGLLYQLPDSVFNYPVKFGLTSPVIPLATGVEARLIQAEAALPANGGTAAVWAADLNALRASAPSTYLGLADTLPWLTADSTVTAGPTEQVDVMFRERAFWLFGTGTRLGDLRRLIRQYGRAANTAFPTGAYAPTLQGNPNWATHFGTPIPNYGNDVSITLPSAASGNGSPTANPHYHGCLTSTTSA